MNATALRATLEALYSERDNSGNCYWALRYTDHATGKVVQGTISGGESNIYAILRVSDPTADDWDRSILFRCDSMKKRDFRGLTAGWEYAGCTPDDLWKFIQAKLNSPDGFIVNE